jgi:hypothetical protein
LSWRIECKAYQVQLACKIWGTTVRRFVAVCLVVLEELPLVLERIGDRLLILDIPLSSVHNWDITQPQRNDATGENVDNVCSIVHQVDLGQHTDCPLSFGVNFSCELQTIRVGQIGVCGGDCQYDGIGFANLLHDHFSNLSLNVPWLISNRHLCQTGQVNQCERKDVGRVDPQVDGRWRNTRIATSLGFCLPYNFFPNLIEIMELLAGNVQELAPLVRVVLVICRLDFLGYAICLCLRCAVDELENERSSRNNTGSSRQAVRIIVSRWYELGLVARHRQAPRGTASTYKSRPTMFSSTELFPLDCDPTTAICGRSMGFWT